MYNINPIAQTDTVFLGDSLTESFDLQKHFGRNDLRNRGISGNMTQDVLYRIEEITNAKPARVFLMIGINDIFNELSEETVVSNIEKIVNEISAKCSDTVLFAQSILPVNETNLIIDENLNTKIYKINNRLRFICKEKDLRFIDIHPDFLNKNGEMDAEYTYDGVHLTEQGYILWAELVQEYL
ncbi:MAG: hypothetical protein H8D45_12980 [Bacteroidetes bacterium]|nr:hypothetical protein [Bacteroidota bacterium]